MVWKKICELDYYDIFQKRKYDVFNMRIGDKNEYTNYENC